MKNKTAIPSLPTNKYRTRGTIFTDIICIHNNISNDNHTCTFENVLLYSPTTVGVPRRTRLAKTIPPAFHAMPTINKHNAVRIDNYCGKNFNITARTGLVTAAQRRYYILLYVKKNCRGRSMAFQNARYKFHIIYPTPAETSIDEMSITNDRYVGMIIIII